MHLRAGRVVESLSRFPWSEVTGEGWSVDVSGSFKTGGYVAAKHPNMAVNISII